MKSIITCLVTVHLLGNLSFAQTNTLQDEPLDSIITRLNNHFIGDVDDFYEIAWESIVRAAKEKDDQSAAELHSLLSDWIYVNLERFPIDSSIYHRNKQIAYHQKIGDLLAVGDGYVRLATDYLSNNQLKEAQTSILNAVEIFEESDEPILLAQAYSKLVELHLLLQEPEQAIKYADLCLSTLIEDEDYINAVNVLFCLSEAQRLMNNLTEASAALDQCIEMANEIQFQQYQEILIYAYRGKGEIYLTQRDYPVAVSFFTKAWEMDVEYHSNEVAERYRYEIGDVLFLQGKYEEALPHLQAGTLARKDYEREFAPKYLLRLSECYQRLGRYREALDYRIQGVELQEQINQDKIANLESEAIIKYETGKKDQQLEEQAQQLQQQRKIQWLSIGIAFLLALLLSTLFYFFRRNQKATAALAMKNAENELLLKEIHHRVKNNLEMVSSLLKLQSVKTKDEAARDVMKASQNRVQSMGIIHQKLYQGENLGSIEMLDYFENLSENIIDAFGANDRVEVSYDMPAIDLDVDTAVPIGLIVNELLTNSLKYAFPEDRKGRIELSLQALGENQLQLVVADNGVGQVEETKSKGTGFGSQLVQLLTSQLQGSMQADYSNGTRLSFQFEKANWD